MTILLIVLLGFLNCNTKASSCSTENDCLHFEHCCKGNCTSKRIQCEHICSHDTECMSTHTCILGLCVNCTEEFSCDEKTCINDSHCPGTHTCEKEVCTVKKPSDLTAEMLPFIIFITALSVSLLIVCYNDYILERLGHRGCMECMENRVCTCSLFLKIWMWRHQRNQERTDHESSHDCPAIAVRFDSRTINPSNSLNEKRETGLFWSTGTLLGRLMFWRRNPQSNIRSTQSNDEETSRENSNSTGSTRTFSSVVLLNEFMNTNGAVAGASTSEITLPDTINTSGTTGNRKVSVSDRTTSLEEGKETCLANNSSFGREPTSFLDCNEDNVNRSCTDSIRTSSRHVTIV